LKDLIDKITWWDTQRQLFAKGHSLGALMDDLDRYKNSGKHSIPESAMYLKSCTTLDAEFESWYEELLENSPCPIHWTPYHQESGKESQIVFANLHLAHLMLDYWALRLILTTTINIVCKQVPKEVPASVRGVVDHLLEEHGKTRQLELAENIMLSMPYCMNAVSPILITLNFLSLWMVYLSISNIFSKSWLIHIKEHGVSSSQKCLFSGRVALYALRMYSTEKLPEYEETYADLTAKKGLRFAKEIDRKVMTGWSPHLSEIGRN